MRLCCTISPNLSWNTHGWYYSLLWSVLPVATRRASKKQRFWTFLPHFCARLNDRIFSKTFVSKEIPSFVGFFLIQGTFVGMVSSLIFTMWIGFGQTVAKNVGSYSVAGKPGTTIEGCPAEWVAELNRTIEEKLAEAAAEPPWVSFFRQSIIFTKGKFEMKYNFAYMVRFTLAF